MSVHELKSRRSPGAPHVPRPSGSPSTDWLADWIRGLRDAFQRPSQLDRWAAADRLAGAFRCQPGPYDPRPEMDAALRSALASGGALDAIPEAHIAFARL